MLLLLLLFVEQVDHFSFTNKDMFYMKYLINDTYWARENGPIFFYAGNEGAIEMFCEHTVSVIIRTRWGKKKKIISTNNSLTPLNPDRRQCSNWNDKTIRTLWDLKTKLALPCNYWTQPNPVDGWNSYTVRRVPVSVKL